MSAFRCQYSRQDNFFHSGDHSNGIDLIKRIMSLWRFIWRDRLNRRYLWAWGIISLGLWLLFKLLYPYPNLVLDSYYYVKAAVLDLDTNAWPIGYSKFIRVFNLFSHSDNLLVGIQYLFLQLTCLVFFFTWLFLFRPAKLTGHLLFVLLFINPLFLYCSNYILSDPLFIGLSILWISQLLWVIYRPRPYMIITHALLLAAAFTVRYNALYYPIIGTLAFILSRQRIWLKLTGIFLPVALMAVFILYTSGKVADITGERQFSAFGGWKMANDALYMYAHFYMSKTAPVPEKFRTLDSMAKQYFVAYKDSGDLLKSDYTSGSFFMFAGESPLVQYMFHQVGIQWRWPFLNTKEWLSVGPFFQAYGIYLIREHPVAFARWFIWPNFLRYINPPGEVFGSKMPFHLIEPYGGEYIRRSLGLNAIVFTPSSIALSEDILYFYPKILAMIHLGFVIGLLGFAGCHGFRRIDKPYSNCLIMIVCLWCCDLGFSVLSAGVVLRYEIFIMVVEMVFGLYFIDYTYRNADQRSPIIIHQH